MTDTRRVELACGHVLDMEVPAPSDPEAELFPQLGSSFCFCGALALEMLRRTHAERMDLVRRKLDPATLAGQEVA